jgi:hypothetical protein
MPLSSARNAQWTPALPVSNPFFLNTRLLLSPSWLRPETPARPLVVPPEGYSHGGGLGPQLFHEGRETADASQFSKKKIMKTTKSKNMKGLLADTANQSLPTPAQPVEKQDTRLPIDSEARKANRTLPTDKVLALLQQHDRRLWELAEVVGKWIWVSFSEQPAPTVRQTLAQLGFHWNRTRQAWQHPCGQFRLSSAGDPHEKYPTYSPADHTTN